MVHQKSNCGEMASIGVVVVSYNAVEAVRVTLASVRRAHNDTAFKLILIDNASESSERERIRATMSRHIAEIGPSWRYIEQEENLGFAGGNNIGISLFLADDNISHICLLNSDVIVTDHWLDRLLASGSDIVSAVTNKADSEQCVPIDYQVDLGECLDEGSEKIQEKIYCCISEFAERWYEAWRGNHVETEVTFFCVLLSTKACRDIGLLDDAFFPGGFEDDDYCMRAQKAGYGTCLARDVFIHHWGSASFGQLQYEYFSERAQKNKEYLEKKHCIVWQRRPEKPIVSFAMDINFTLNHLDRFALQTPFIELYRTSLSKLIKYFDSEFHNLQHALGASSGILPEALKLQVEATETYGDLNARLKNIFHRLADVLAAGEADVPLVEVIESDLKSISKGIRDKVECNFAIHKFITNDNKSNSAESRDMPSPLTAVPMFDSRPTTRAGKFWWILRRGLGFILQFNGIVFFGGYCYPERQSDGYFQRIRAVDYLFADRWRVYVESDELRGRNIWFDRPEPQVLVLRINGTKKRRMLVRMLALLAVLRCRKIYFHSVLRMYDNRFGQLLRLPFIRKAVDIHGVVPEEFRMHNDFFSAVLYEKEEKLALEKAGIAIVVSDAMKQYLRQKFRDEIKAQIVSFPIFPNFNPIHSERALVDGKPVVVYAGGLHKWQQVPKMIDAIIMTADRFDHRFYCPEPQIVNNMLPPDVASLVTVESKTHAELMTLYPECHYGFILREEIIVNRAACPTKLVEYLAMGIVPIVDSEEIGDFKLLGMQFIKLNDFLAGRLPSQEQRLQMATSNFSVYERLKNVRESGADTIQTFFSLRKQTEGFYQSTVNRVRSLLPPDTIVGKMARRAWYSCKKAEIKIEPPTKDGDLRCVRLSMDELMNMSTCDILVQVNNFEAGGLENVVIDMNTTFIKVGCRVVLLVLGKHGPAVIRARDLGHTVICCEYNHDIHLHLIDRLQPKIVLAHYSFIGAELYRQRSIPFVQVIHNIYMWFSDVQRREFMNAAEVTTTFVAVSDDVKNYSVKRLGVDAEKCIVIPNGIDLDPFKALDMQEARTRLRARYGIADEEFVFLDIGAINHQKNHIGMIKSFELALKVCTNSRLAILGPCYEPGLEQEMLAYVEKKGLEDKVIYCGSSPSVHEHLAMADTFASAAFFEGGPLTLLEALAANLPVAMPAVGVAQNFAGREGIKLVTPAQDMVHFNGAIWEMKSTQEFEKGLVDAMVKTWKKPVRPNLSETELAALGKGYAYDSYLRLIADIIGGEIGSEDNTAALKVV